MRPNDRRCRDSEGGNVKHNLPNNSRCKHRFRRGDTTIPGQWVVTTALSNHILETEKVPLDVIEFVRTFDTFTEDNDAYGTHEFGSPDPTDLSQTVRMMTIMAASDQ